MPTEDQKCGQCGSEVEQLPGMTEKRRDGSRTIIPGLWRCKNDKCVTNGERLEG